MKKIKPPPGGHHGTASHLFDMLESALKIREYTHGMAIEDFWDASAVRDAVALRLAMIGEAARGVDARTQKTLKSVPFANIRGLRNRIVHDYGAVNFRIVWKIVQEDILPLIEILEAHLSKK